MKQSFLIGLLFYTLFNPYSCICKSLEDSLDFQESVDYDFIALVKINDIKNHKEPTYNDFNGICILTIDILELFKGDKVKEIFEHVTYTTACDIKIRKGEEWIIYGNIENSKIVTTNCTPNVKYKDTNEVRDWMHQRGFYQLNKLRNYFNIKHVSIKDGYRREYYSNGQLEINEYYSEGKKLGIREIWYPNGSLYCRQSYIHDTLDGKSEWFYPSGQIFKEDYYLKGKHYHVSRIYYDSSLNNFPENIWGDAITSSEDSFYQRCQKLQIQYETVYNSDGNAIVYREYRRNGKIDNERYRVPEKEYEVYIGYHENGLISSISHSLNGKNFGVYQSYNEDGTLSRSWEYNANGKIKSDKDETFSFHNLNEFIAIENNDEIIKTINEEQAKTPTALISTEAMNVLYIGLENPISVLVSGIPFDEATVHITNGVLVKTNEAGKYLCKVERVRGMRTKIIVSIKLADGSLKTIGEKEYRIREVPYCQLLYGNLKGGIQQKGAIMVQSKLNASLGSFAFKDVQYTVTGYQATFIPKEGDSIIINVTGNSLYQVNKLFQLAKSGDKVVFSNVEIEGPVEIERNKGLTLVIEVK
jgi:antitoxin component YwqK of YwqJK toxin-antitoxin module